MTREQYEDRFWKVSDEKWNELVEKGLVPEDTPKAWAKWNEMMKTRKPISESAGMKFYDFTEDEVLFMGYMDLVRFGEKFLAEAAWYMELSE